MWPWRHEMLLLTGLLGMTYMAISLLLALRLPQLEVWCGGLDRMLRFHRQTAIGGALALTAHWLLVEMPKWAVSAGWLSRPARRGPVQLELVQVMASRSMPLAIPWVSGVSIC